MGIEVEFNPDLCLRRSEVFPARADTECIPEPLEVGEDYEFLKRGQRCFFFGKEVPLRETRGYGRLGKPIASIMILEATHYFGDDPGGDYKGVWTKGRYRVVEVFNPDDKTIHFEGFERRRG